MRRFLKAMLAALVVGATVTLFGLNANAETVEAITNGNFDNSDTSMWSVASGSASITAVESDGPIFDEVMSYGMIAGRTAAYEGFAQDLTGRIEPGVSYKFSFYACLSEKYKDAPANQRTVEFSPYYSADGNTTYLGSWSPELSGTVSKALNPGEWTRFEGTLELPNGLSVDEFVIRIIEQGTDYGQGECVLGDFYVTGVSITSEVVEETGDDESETPLVTDVNIDTSVKPLRDAVTEVMGEDTIVGCAVTLSEINDIGVEKLIEHHYNAITLGNELKPDALFGYSNDKCPGTETAELNGKSIVVPKMDYSRAEKILDKIYDWNQANPDRFIKVRGHVLVWHSQTPEWFFHVDYDPSKDYVSKDEMNERLEWYIKTVLTHFAGPDSKYSGMFYGWDVVNEAISDGTNTYRSDAENKNEPLSKSTHGSNSSWWHVYNSNEFIINAFKYANMYAPKEVELYYNDYNETNVLKCKGIIALIEAVKAAEGTRLDGMGMQGHYNASDLMQDQVEMALKKYCDAAGKVMITEWDLKATSSFDGTDETKPEEYNKEAHRYELVYDRLLELQAKGYNIGGFVFWGTIDKYSWLQTNSGVGGGADGKQMQCPLLFDDNYRIKPAYWAFVDKTHINDDFTAWKEQKKALEAEAEKNEEATETSANEPDTKDESSEASTEASEAADNNEAVADSSDAVPADTPEPVNKLHKAPSLSTVFIGVGVVLIIYGIIVLVDIYKKKKKNK